MEIWVSRAPRGVQEYFPFEQRTNELVRLDLFPIPGGLRSGVWLEEPCVGSKPQKGEAAVKGDPKSEVMKWI